MFSFGPYDRIHEWDTWYDFENKKVYSVYYLPDIQDDDEVSNLRLIESDYSGQTPL